MKSFVKRSVAVAFALMVAAPVAAQDLAILLSPREANRLPAEARAFYDEAVIANDHINYDEVVFLLAKAAERAPESVDLQFLTERRARDRAEIYYSSSTFIVPPPENMDYSSPPHKVAEPFLEIAEQALQRLVANTSLSSEERRRLDEENSLLQEFRTLLPLRDKARLDTGLPLVTEIQEARRDFMGGGTTDVDPLDPYFAYADRPTETPTAPGTEEEEPTQKNPFELLPGEYIKPFLPTPTPLPQGGPGYGPGGVDEFGNPIGPPPGAFDPAAGPNPFGDAPAADPGAMGGDPFGGGAAPPPPAPDPFGGGGGYK